MNYSDHEDIIICDACMSEFAVAQFGVEEQEVCFCPICGNNLHEEDYEDDDEDEDEREDDY